MGKKIAIAVAMIALMATSASAAVQNVKVGGNLKTTSVIRNSFDLGDNTAVNKSQNVILAQTDLSIEADLTDNVSVMVGLQNERLWGTDVTASGDNSDLNIDTAYVKLEEFLYAPLTVTIGRQPLVYGNAMIIGDGDKTTEVASVSDLTGGKNFDAIKAVFDYDPLVIDVFAAKTSEDTVTAANDDDDSNLYGVNAAFGLGDDRNTQIEAYVFASSDKTGIVGTQEKTTKLYIPGLRVSTNPFEGVSLSLEGAMQFGTDAQTGAAAAKEYGGVAIQALASWALPVMEDMSPVMSLGYSYFSGDEDTTDEDTDTWQSAYEDQYTGRIFDGLLGSSSNIKIIEVGLEVVPMEDMTAKLTWYNLSQAEKTAITGVNQTDGAAIGLTGTGKADLGDEVALDLAYAYTEDVTLGLSAGVFLPGDAFDAVNKDSAQQMLTSINVAF